MERLTPRESAPTRRANSGTPTPGPTIQPWAARDALAPIPNNNLSTYTSTVDANHPGNEVLANNPDGAPYRVPSGPGNLIDPVASKLMQYFPEPNLNVGGSNYSPFFNRVDSGSTKSSNNQWDLKIDYQFSQKNLLSAKYSQQGSNSTPFNCFNTLADPCSSGPSYRHRPHVCAE